MVFPMPEWFEGLDQVRKERLGPFRITASIREFSKENIYHPWDLNVMCLRNTDYSELAKPHKSHFGFQAFANGWNKDSTGYVCIRLWGDMVWMVLKGTCLVSVIDGNGDERFTRSFTFSDFETPRTCQPRNVTIKYFPRETLLRDPDDLLPNDTLTIRTDIYVENCTDKYEQFHDAIEKFVLQYFQIETVPQSISGSYGSLTEIEMYLLLDNEFVTRLSQESEYFKRILNTPLVERKNRRMRLDTDEYTTFLKIAKIFIGMNPLKYYSITDILDMCVIAEKYDIPSVMQTCLCFLKLIFSDHDADENLKLYAAYEFGGSKYDLSDVIHRAINDAQETKDGREQAQNSEWVYRRDDEDATVICFENRKRPALQVDVEKRMISYEENEFDFYK